MNHHHHLRLDRLFLSCAATLSFATGCVAAEKAQPPGGNAAVAPESADLCNEKGDVKYAAKWEGGKVTLTAKGTHNTGGYEVSFRQSKEEIFPPQFSLVHKRPDGFATQAITPFSVSTSFPAGGKPEIVIVNDARGVQRVKVD